MEKNVGEGSQYLWTYHDADGNYLDGAKELPTARTARHPDQEFLVRGGLRHAEPFRVAERTTIPLSGYTDPAVNSDGSVDIVFGPHRPADSQNWIATVPGRGWFPIVRFYGPTEAYFAKTWQLEDITAI